MTISIGTFDDLQPDRGRPIDRDPIVSCSECDEKQLWSKWVKQYPEITPETNLLCRFCRADERVGEWHQHRIEQRKEKNHQLLEYGGEHQDLEVIDDV